MLLQKCWPNIFCLSFQLSVVITGGCWIPESTEWPPKPTATRLRPGCAWWATTLEPLPAASRWPNPTGTASNKSWRSTARGPFDWSPEWTQWEQPQPAPSSAPQTATPSLRTQSGSGGWGSCVCAGWGSRDYEPVLLRLLQQRRQQPPQQQQRLQQEPRRQYLKQRKPPPGTTPGSLWTAGPLRTRSIALPRCPRRTIPSNTPLIDPVPHLCYTTTLLTTSVCCNITV